MDILKHSIETQGNIFAPEFFQLSNASSKLSLDTLLAQNPHIAITDDIVGQVRELIKSRNPKGLKIEELDKLTEQTFGGSSTDVYGVWVYYPWLSKLVHILNESEFIELRTNRNQNKITIAERDTLASKKIGIIGLSVGQSIALTLIMERGCGELRLADFDRLELSNLNRIRTPLYNIGEYKVVATAREIAEIDPFIKVSIFTEGVTKENMSEFMLGNGKLDLLVDECDGLDMKIQAREFAKQHRIPVIMDTSDRGMLDVERFDLNPDLPILHGFVEGMDSNSLGGLTNEQKIPYIMKILGASQLSARAKASALEVEQSISTWPQLATSVILGGAVGADVSRRILLDQFHESGRYYVDLEEIISDPVETNNQNLEIKIELDEKASKFIVMQVPIPKISTQILPDHQHLEEIIHAACLAPSGGNCQPWKWVLKNNSIVLVHDKVRSDSLLDFNNTGTFLSFGAAIENFVVKAQSLGYEVSIEYKLQNIDDEVIAIFSFFPQGIEGVDIEATLKPTLVDALETRETNRKNEGRFPIEQNKIDSLKHLVSEIPHAEVQIVNDVNRLSDLGKLIGEIDRLWILDEKGHTAFMDEIRWTPEEVESTRDGLDIETLELSKMDVTGLSLTRDHRVVSMLNQWGLGKILTRMSGKSLDSASAMALFTMPGTSPMDFIQGGRAVERFWLEATNLGITIQPMSISIFLFGRLIQGKGEGLTAKMKEELPFYRKSLLKIFDINEDKGLIFMLRLSKASMASVKSLRLKMENVYYR